eukprot:scaffold21359_cov18-Phaeocystis_antarctica.AAC.1
MRAVAHRDAEGAREAEVGELELAVLVNEKILRLQVAVQHPPVVAEGHPAQQLPQARWGARVTAAWHAMVWRKLLEKGE